MPLFLCKYGYGVSQYIQSVLNEACFKYYELFLYIWFIYCYSVNCIGKKSRLKPNFNELLKNPEGTVLITCCNIKVWILPYSIFMYFVYSLQ